MAAVSLLPRDAVRIRMYRVGFGDCFLLSLPVGEEHAHVLIDCGVHSRGNIGTLEQVVDDIVRVSQDRLAVVVASHAHQDHISGFATHEARFREVRAGEVWMPWTENPSDTQAAGLRERQLALAAQLRDHFAARGDLDGEVGAALENIVGFELASNRDALRVLRAGFLGPTRVRYLEAGDTLEEPAEIKDLRVTVLGPPRDQNFLSKMDPPAGQRLLRLKGRAEVEVGALRPFLRWRRTRTQLREVYRRPPLVSRDVEGELRERGSEPLERLALALDRVVNNTSLVLFLEFRGLGFLLPGDAQWGNWKAWLDSKNAADLLSRVTVYKVGHHGSHNATPRSAVDAMTSPELIALVSTQREPWESIPRKSLLEALAKRTRGRVVRSDWVKIPDAPNERIPARLPKRFSMNSLAIDYLVTP